MCFVWFTSYASNIFVFSTASAYPLFLIFIYIATIWHEIRLSSNKPQRSTSLFENHQFWQVDKSCQALRFRHVVIKVAVNSSSTVYRRLLNYYVNNSTFEINQHSNSPFQLLRNTSSSIHLRQPLSVIADNFLDNFLMTKISTNTSLPIFGQRKASSTCGNYC